jgi:hypothetical protein
VAGEALPILAEKRVGGWSIFRKMFDPFYFSSLMTESIQQQTILLI